MDCTGAHVRGVCTRGDQNNILTPPNVNNNLHAEDQHRGERDGLVFLTTGAGKKRQNTGCETREATGRDPSDVLQPKLSRSGGPLALSMGTSFLPSAQSR
uniref:Uncharacterized protein n=1 Tax=Sphaerodactylus townsendi TaxID=933632 RepID=A0ACB8E9W7_9SAUR